MNFLRNTENVLFVFVLIFQVVEALISYSQTVYGKKEITNKFLVWMVVHLGFIGTFFVTRGLVMFLYILFMYLSCTCLYTVWLSILLLAVYLYKLTNGKNC